MQRLQVSGAVRPLYESLGVKGLIYISWLYLKFLRIHLSLLRLLYVRCYVNLESEQCRYTGLFEMTVGVLTTCHTQYT